METFITVGKEWDSHRDLHNCGKGVGIVMETFITVGKESGESHGDLRNCGKGEWGQSWRPS